ncbi:MAG: hypothetical protein F6K19_35360 [Cyanothece sp. SIO1E1]|nr:hypothetical protein [Cyanothece sp. SIO1E1]
MSTITPQQISEFASDVSKLSIQFRFLANMTQTSNPIDSKDLLDLSDQLKDISLVLVDKAIALSVAGVDEAAQRIMESTDRVLAAVKTISDIRNAFTIASALLGVATAITAGFPVGIVSGLAGLLGALDAVVEG